MSRYGDSRLFLLSLTTGALKWERVRAIGQVSASPAYSKRGSALGVESRISRERNIRICVSAVKTRYTVAGKAKATAKLNDDVKWISTTLTEQQTANMKRLFPTWGEVGLQLQNLVDDGYKYTVSIDKYNKCYSCYVFPIAEDNPNHGAILTSRGNSVYSALRGAVYRHFAVYDRLWGQWSKEVIDEE